MRVVVPVVLMILLGLPAGAYEVAWTAVADDGHVMNGRFNFSVSEAEAAKIKR